MGFSRRPGSSPAAYGSQGPPAWLVFLLGVALVFGAFYIWNGVRDFVAAGGRSINQATAQANIATATAEQVEALQMAFTPRPTSTPVPECQEFVVIVDAAVVRQQPSTSSPPVTTLARGEQVCVIERSGDWYLIDQNPATRRIEPAYMFENIIEALNPTPTPTRTYTPAPTITTAPTQTPSITPSPMPTPTIDPNATATPTPSPTFTPTLPMLSA